jgi:hypothetical protein
MRDRDRMKPTITDEKLHKIGSALDLRQHLAGLLIPKSIRYTQSLLAQQNIL